MGRPEHMEPTTQPNGGDGCQITLCVGHCLCKVTVHPEFMWHLRATHWQSPQLRITINGSLVRPTQLPQLPSCTVVGDHSKGFLFLWMMAVKDM